MSYPPIISGKGVAVFIPDEAAETPQQQAEEFGKSGDQFEAVGGNPWKAAVGGEQPKSWKEEAEAIFNNLAFDLPALPTKDEQDHLIDSIAGVMQVPVASVHGKPVVPEAAFLRQRFEKTDAIVEITPAKIPFFKDLHEMLRESLDDRKHWRDTLEVIAAHYESVEERLIEQLEALKANRQDPSFTQVEVNRALERETRQALFRLQREVEQMLSYRHTREQDEAVV